MAGVFRIDLNGLHRNTAPPETAAVDQSKSEQRTCQGGSKLNPDRIALEYGMFQRQMSESQ